MRSCSRQGQTPLWLTKANQKRASLGSVRLSRRLSPGTISRRTWVSISPSSEMTEVKVMLLTRAGSSLAASWRSSCKREREGRFDEAIGEVGRGGRQVLLERARDALPFGGLQRGGRSVHAHLQAAAGLHGHEPALEVHVRRLAGRAGRSPSPCPA